jgi:hypothetical protein
VFVRKSTSEHYEIGLHWKHHLGEDMTARMAMTFEESQELRLLRAEYFDATKRAAEAMQTGEAPFDVSALGMVLSEDARAGKAMQRITEIYDRRPQL